MYLARLLLLGIEKKLPQQPVHQNREEGNPSNILNLTALGEKCSKIINIEA